MADDRQAALGAIDPKGNIVLKEFNATSSYNSTAGGSRRR